MTRFIRTNAGWINTAHIARAVPVYSRERKYQIDEWVFYAPNGERIGATPHYQFDPEEAFATYLPAAGIVATIIYWNTDTQAEPTLADLDVSRVPVIAWRILGPGYLEPEFPEVLASNAVCLIEYPDGSYVEMESRSFHSLDDAKQGVLQRAQDEWHQKHKPAA